MSTVVYNGDGRPLLYVPNWFAEPGTRLMKWVNNLAASDSATRRKFSRREPLIFAMLYLRHQLWSETTQWRRSLNPLHIFLAEEAATYWPRRLRPKEHRVAVVAPRDSGKTTHDFLINPLWGAAHGWKDFPLFLSDSGPRAEEHLANLRDELATNDKLQEDFPDLCEPARRNGRSLGDSSTVFRSASGVTFMARGIDAKNLGMRERRERPDLIVVDDIEPYGSYSNDTKDKRLSVLLNGVLPMNLNASVYLVGTVVRHGSIMHGVVQADTGNGVANWIREERFRTKYFPAYSRSRTTGVEESFWPEKWSMDFIREERKTATFQLGMMNQPIVPGSGLFTAADMHFGAPFVIDSCVLAIDPAVSAKETSDYTGIAVIGFDASRTRASVEYARGVRLEGERLRELVRLVCSRFPLINLAVIESNQGGSFTVDALRGALPPGVVVRAPHEHAPKTIRIRELHNWAQRKQVFVGADANAFVEQALAYPDVTHDDVIDAVAKGCHAHLGRTV
jgi:predicted phage terminase large subunit-like protein